MNRRLVIITVLFIVYALGLALTIPAIASNITNADYYAIIKTTNNSTAAVNVSSNISGLDTPDLIAAGFLNSSANNCAIISSSGVDMPFMPGYTTSPWIIYTGNLSAGGIINSTAYFKNVTGGKICYFPGAGGMTVPDGITEPGAAFELRFTDIFVDTTAGASKYIFSHQNGAWDGLEMFVSATASGNITFRVYTAGAVHDVSLNSIGTGEHDITITLDGGGYTFTVDSNSNTMAGFAMGNPAAIWTFCENDTVLYVGSIEYDQGGAPVSAWGWEYDTTFHDSIGANDGTPNFRTTSSDADVSSMLTSFLPVDTPKAPAFVLGAGPDFLTDNLSANSTYGIGDNVTFTYPGEDIIRSISDSTGTPYQIPSTFIASFVIIIISMLASYFLKTYSASSIFAKSIVNICLYGGCVALGIYDWWMLIFFFIFEQAIWFGAQHRRE